MIFEFPFPPKELNPNVRNKMHWARIHKTTKSYREECYWIVIKSKKVPNYQPSEKKLKLKITFFPPDRRRRDDDNIIGSFKAGRDGVARAWQIDDYNFRCSYHFEDPIENGKVVVEVLNG